MKQLHAGGVLALTIKKSSTRPNCLAISSTHVFAAQFGKAVVHVYSLAKGLQEAVVPFADRLSCISLIGDGNRPGVLALGTENGRVILWEVRDSKYPRPGHVSDRM